MELADSFRNATALLHQRGHVIPALQEPQLAVMKAFIQAAASAPEPPAAHIPVSLPVPLPAQCQEQQQHEQGQKQPQESRVLLRQPTAAVLPAVAAMGSGNARFTWEYVEGVIIQGGVGRDEDGEAETVGSTGPQRQGHLHCKL
ncbi:hypothetical protein Vretimale_11880 [Volvox reticuliferus]|nr:hypothetical protein Vretimale_11880 [Volvox reticuliferus]